MGTALTVDQIKLIRRYSTNVVMLFDTDPAGQAAIIRSLDLLIDEGMNVKVTTLAQGEDPDSFIRNSGLSAFQERLQKAHSLFEYKFNWLSSQIDGNSIEGKSKICQEMLLTIGRFKNEVTKFELMKLLASKLNLPQEVVLKQSQSSQVDKFKVVQAVESKPVVKTFVPKPHEELLIALFIDDHQWVLEAQKVVTLDDFTQGLTRDIVGKIWQMTQVNGQWEISQLMAELNDEAVLNLIAKLLSNADARNQDIARIFQDCIERILKERKKKQIKLLQDQIKEAESKADQKLLEQLGAKYQELITTQ